jgi:predicted nucleic acid-binding protein
MDVLVDASVWIDHLHRTEPTLVTLLGQDAVVSHDAIIGELALGSLPRRREFLANLVQLRRLPAARHDECLRLIEQHRLWGQGLGWIDVQLLAAALVNGARLWTRDRALRASARKLVVAYAGDRAME